MFKSQVDNAIAQRGAGTRRSNWITFAPHKDRLFQMMPQLGVPDEARFMYQFESRQLAELRWPGDTYTWTRWRLRLFVYAAFWFWVFMLAGTLASNDDPLWGGLMNNVIQLAFIFSVLDKFLFDFIALLTGIEQVNRDFREGRWSMVAITNVSMGKLVQAKFAVAQLRAWRSVTNVIGLRLFVLLLLLLQNFVTPLFTATDGPLALLGDIRINSLDDLLATLLLMAAFIGMAVIYLVEPRWRLRALSAASISISARTDDVGGGLLYAALSFFSVWWIQVSSIFVTIIAVVLPMSILGGMLSQRITSLSTFGGLMLVFLVFTLGYFLRQFYHAFAGRRMADTYWRLVKRGGAP